MSEPDTTADLRLARDFPKGEVLFREGEAGEYMYVVQSGVVQISRKMGGLERVLANLGRGEFLGEMALLNDKPRNATATVTEDARMLVIDRQTLESMLVRSPDIALSLVKKLARRLDGADTMVEILLNPDPKARVLLALKKRVEERSTAEGTVTLDLEKDDLTSEFGADPQRLGEIMLRLRRLKIAAFDDASSVVTITTSRYLEFLEFLESGKGAAARPGAPPGGAG